MMTKTMTRNINRNAPSPEFNVVVWLIKNAIITIIAEIPLYAVFFESDPKIILGVFCFFYIVTLIADAIRYVVKPQVTITKGGAWNIMENKIYWSIGPQFKCLLLAYWIVFIVLGDKINGTEISTNVTEDHNTVVEHITNSQELRYRD